MRDWWMVASRVSVVVAVLLCLLMSISLFLSGLEVTPRSWDTIDVKSLLLFEGMLGILVSAFSLTSVTLIFGERRLLLSAMGACFLIFQGLHILWFVVMTNGPLGVIAIGISITGLSLVGLVFNFMLTRSRLAATERNFPP